MSPRSSILCIVLLASISCADGDPVRTAIDPEMALQPPAIVEVLDGKYADENRAWQGIPGVERAPGGRLWATWYAGGTGEGPLNFVLLSTSDDNGDTWSKPTLAVDPEDPVRSYDPCLWTDPQGRLWLFWAQSAGLWDGRGGVWAMVADNPDAIKPNWSAPHRIADGVMMNKPTVLKSGEWLLPIAGWRFKEPRIEDGLVKMGHPAPAEAAEAFARTLAPRDGSMVYASADEGKTFEYRGQALVPEPQHDEHMVVERRDDGLWMLIRTAYGIGESVSTDNGVTWSAGGPSGIEHPVTRFFVRRLQSGRLLLVRHIPDAEDPRLRANLAAYLSDDDGVTWKGGLMLDERANVSYPDGTEAPDGTLYIIYDRERSAAKEILLARIREDDILAGKVISDDSRLRLRVNQATGKK